MTKQNWKRLSLCLEPKDYQKLRVMAANEGTTMSELIRKWILWYLSTNPDKPKQP